MAIQLDLPLTKKATHPDAYAMVADSHTHHFDDYVEVWVNVYEDEDARWQRVPDDESERRKPLSRIRVEIPKAIFDAELREAARAYAAELYRVLTTYAAPHGLAEFFADGRRHDNPTEENP